MEDHYKIFFCEESEMWILSCRPWVGSHIWKDLFCSHNKDDLYIEMHKIIDEFKRKMNQTRTEYYSISGERLWLI